MESIGDPPSRIFWTLCINGCGHKSWADDDNGIMTEMCYICDKRARNECALKALLLRLSSSRDTTTSMPFEDHLASHCLAMNTMEFVFGDGWKDEDPCGKCGRDWFKSGWVCPDEYEDLCEIEHMCGMDEEEMWDAIVADILSCPPDDEVSSDDGEVSSDGSTA